MSKFGLSLALLAIVVLSACRKKPDDRWLATFENDVIRIEARGGQLLIVESFGVDPDGWNAFLYDPGSRRLEPLGSFPRGHIVADESDVYYLDGEGALFRRPIGSGPDAGVLLARGGRRGNQLRDGGDAVYWLAHGRGNDEIVRLDKKSAAVTRLAVPSAAELVLDRDRIHVLRMPATTQERAIVTVDRALAAARPVHERLKDAFHVTVAADSFLWLNGETTGLYTAPLAGGVVREIAPSTVGSPWIPPEQLQTDGVHAYLGPGLWRVHLRSGAVESLFAGRKGAGNTGRIAGLAGVDRVDAFHVRGDRIYAAVRTSECSTRSCLIAFAKP